ncbi:MAG TPA: Rieske 2Fe-2S domain-containing protein [Baekduia sp.]|nr:Rieske 2Fe-2S domain-containing protein [Baekduia sp.]
MSAPASLLLHTRDPLVERRVQRVARRLGLQALLLTAGPGEQAGGEPAGLLVELGVDGAVDVVAAWRTARPELAIVAYLATPQPDLWAAAERAGADAVTTRGRADRELERVVEDRRSGARAARRVRAVALRDVAGRLGFVGRLDGTPAGDIALFHVGGQVRAVAARCPHAGGDLCAGELAGDVVTCPRHGSQFRVTDGARVRGPADLGLVTYPTVVVSGEVWVEMP